MRISVRSPGSSSAAADKPGPGETLRRGTYGRVSFANSDLSGIMDHRMSIREAQRAVEQIVPAIERA